MGAADVVPGVSGGTVAFITGIYSRLMTALSRLDLTSAKLVLSGRIAAAWQRVDGNFLLTLFVGILLSIFTLARVLSHWLEAYGPVLWGFFSGLILLSGLLMLRDHRPSKWQDLLFLVAGVALAIAVALSGSVETEPTTLNLYLGGVVAISAMILPGISGGFILLLLGLYQPILTAVSELDLVVIITVALGCVTGLLGFSKLLHYLLERFYQPTLLFLTGIVLGSLVKLWPWQNSGTWYSPSRYLSQTGQSDFLIPTIIAVVTGLLLVVLLHRFSNTD